MNDIVLRSDLREEIFQKICHKKNTSVSKIGHHVDTDYCCIVENYSSSSQTGVQNIDEISKYSCPKLMCKSCSSIQTLNPAFRCLQKYNTETNN